MFLRGRHIISLEFWTKDKFRYSLKLKDKPSTLLLSEKGLLKYFLIPRERQDCTDQKQTKADLNFYLS